MSETTIKLNPSMTENELEEAGIQLAKALKWAGTDVLQICIAALEESNFHKEAAANEKLLNDVFEMAENPINI